MYIDLNLLTKIDLVYSAPHRVQEATPTCSAGGEHGVVVIIIESVITVVALTIRAAQRR